MLLAFTAHDIDTAGVAVDAPLPIPWLEAELEDAHLSAKSPGHIVSRLSRTGGDDIVVRARVKASLTTPCARCLDPTPIDIDTDLTLLLRPAPPAPKAGAKGARTKTAQNLAKAKADDEYEFSSAEADIDSYDGETVVLDPFVREAVLLEVPNFPLCSESCPGIRPAGQEGRDTASLQPTEARTEARLDPRLAPLAAVRLNGSASSASPPNKKQKKE